jgi:hypothetical protein
MKTIHAKHKRSEIGTGIQLVTITDMFYLRDAARNIIKIDGFVSIIVKFKNKAGDVHDQMYVWDGDWRQKVFQSMLASTGIEITPGKSPDVKEIIGKKLYIAIQEVHYVDDDKVVIEDGDPKIEHHIFRTFKADSLKPPTIKGNPLVEIRASGEFVTYKNVSKPYVHEAPIKDKPSEVNVDESSDEMPQF